MHLIFRGLRFPVSTLARSNGLQIPNAQDASSDADPGLFPSGSDDTWDGISLSAPTISLTDYFDCSDSRCQFSTDQPSSDSSYNNPNALEAIQWGCSLQLPDRETYSKQSNLVIRASTYSENSGRGPISTIYGDLHISNISNANLMTDPYSYYGADKPIDGSSCYLIGQVNINAGGMYIPTSEAKSLSYQGIGTERRQDLQPNRWLIPALSLMKDFLKSQGKIIDVSQGGTLDDHVKYNIAFAVLVAWTYVSHNMLRRPLPDGNDFVYPVPLSSLRANIKTSRIYIWLALNLMFTLSGILHIILQSRSSRPVVIDTATVALTTDVSKLLLNDNDIKKLHWNNMSYVTNQDASTYDERNKPAERILLKLERGENGFTLTRKND
jgi:hypothetical protein